ncbi:hypothetical protein D5F84_03845 [Streptococcus agalactiae]|nr:hypothetical protein D5F96_00075 [Streptococcus agalactiae]RRA66033.1 hypothetical protein D5F85_00525 [Streptococcus agalactiae]RRA77608.1 hypothetical protein D5F84_05075 [Streptococcus agalactiae]RRA78782.1 hypothetical protein D5F84_03845 [Streptococcus agalactiae]TRM93379.1 hypothetical protein DLM81_08370 [Streptococcus agalactiae]
MPLQLLQEFQQIVHSLQKILTHKLS